MTLLGSAKPVDANASSNAYGAMGPTAGGVAIDMPGELNAQAGVASYNH